MATMNDGSQENGRLSGEADPADVAEQQQSVDPDAVADVIDEAAAEIAVEAEPADVLEQRLPVGGEEDYPRG